MTETLQVEPKSHDYTAFKTFDREKKVLSGRGPEQILKEADQYFGTVFGYDAAMKAYIAFKNRVQPNGTVDSEPEISTDLCIQMLEYRYSLFTANKKLTTEELDFLVFEHFAKQLTTEEPSPDKSFLLNFRADTVLNVGDPHQQLARLFNHPRIVTIDYEYAREAGPNRTRSVAEVFGDIQEQYSNFSVVAQAFTDELPPAVHPGEVMRNADIETWLNGTEASDSHAGEKGLVQAGKEIYDLTLKAKTNPTPENMGHVRRAYKDFQVKMLEGKLKGYVKPTERLPFRDQREEALDISNMLVKEAFYLQATAEKLQVVEHVQGELYPVLMDNIEDVADLFEGLTGQESTDSAKRNLWYTWNDFLRKSGVDPATFKPSEESSKFIDLIYTYMVAQGGEYVTEALPEIGQKMEQALSESVNSAFPDNPKSDRSPIHKGLFPQDTKQFTDGSFNRFLASWSFSTRMLATMSVDELAEEIWPETARLLAKDGIATIFPIGFTTNQDAVNHGEFGEEEDRIRASLDKYIATNPGISYTITPSWDEKMGGMGVLVIKKR